MISDEKQGDRRADLYRRSARSAAGGDREAAKPLQAPSRYQWTQDRNATAQPGLMPKAAYRGGSIRPRQRLPLLSIGLYLSRMATRSREADQVRSKGLVFPHVIGAAGPSA